jgi:Tfp pilus assembly ATPase PilU
MEKENYEVYQKEPKKYVAYLNELMLEKNATDMYLTYNEPPTMRIMEEVHREKDLPKLDDEMLNKIALAMMNKTGLDYFEKY